MVDPTSDKLLSLVQYRGSETVPKTGFLQNVNTVPDVILHLFSIRDTSFFGFPTTLSLIEVTPTR